MAPSRDGTEKEAGLKAANADHLEVQAEAAAGWREARAVWICFGEGATPDREVHLTNRVPPVVGQRKR